MFERIVSQTAVLSGKPCIRGTRISVAFILELIASGASISDIAQAYPQLTVSDVEEALRFASFSLGHETMFTVAIDNANTGVSA
ncbi:MAG: DUF433 domain-containing protein [Candidatus Kapaibacterium sp.]|nr:MAG: DUF433 domain-containing protein [Candidatus Kapabacteria bacterium]